MVEINDQEWRILLVSPHHPGLKRSDGSFSIGVCDNNNKTIYVNDSLTLIKTKKVLCHELTHAAMFSYDINLSLEQEELVADLIATFGQEIVCETNKIFNRIKETWGC